ncbi:MAG: glycosyltransferase family 39 protein, partial [Acidobacteriota bacterium]
MEPQPSHGAAPKPVWRVLRGVLWASWLAFSLSLFARPFLWHAEQFRNPGEAYFKVFLIAMPVWLLGCGCYALLRTNRPEWRKWELPALALVPIGIAFAYEPRAAAAATALAFGAYGWGAAVLRGFRVEPRRALEHVVLPLATGLVVVMVGLFPIGLVGGLRPWVMAALVAGGSWLGRRELLLLPEAVSRLRRDWVDDASLGTALAGFTVPWLFVLANMSVLTALAPSRVFDVVRHHLFDAMMYASWGALRPVEGVSYSFFPQGVELLMAAVLPFGGQIGAQIIPAAFFPVLVLLVWLIARECGASRMEALLGVTLAISVPAVHWTASVAKNDAALAVCLGAALYAYLRYWSEGEDRVMLWGALCLAAALHVKTPAIFGGFALTLLFLHAVWISRARFRLLAGIGAIALAIAPAYFVRAWWFTGEPFYPQSAKIVVGDAVTDYKTKKVSGWRVRDVFEEIHFDGLAAWEFTSTSKNPMGAAL